MSKLSICTNFSSTLSFPDTDTRRPASPQLSAGPIFAGSTIHHDLALPTFDPETGLDLFPRLPEDDDDVDSHHGTTASNDGDITGDATTIDTKTNDGSGTSLRRNLSAAASPTSCPRHEEQLRSHSPTYCKHTWNRDCKCPVILSSSEGGYCWSCRGQRCAAGSASLRAAQLLEITAQ
ncbi:hypothetical protein V2G26_014520 [Clonostachys chloroleuca]